MKKWNKKNSSMGSIFRHTLICSWLFFVTSACIISTLQLMAVFDLHKELAQLPLSTLLGESSPSSKNTDVKPKDNWWQNLHFVRIISVFYVRQQQLAGKIEKEREKKLLKISEPPQYSTVNVKHPVPVNDADSKIKEYQEELNKIKQITDLDQDVVGNIKLKAYIDSLSFSLVPVPMSYIAMPVMMLTLLVSLFMGALGSSIRMTVEFLKSKHAMPGRWWFFQPFLGALLAFAVFILFKAGHIALTGGAVAGTGGELNPYIIAFVGIISGMLSENAYRRIGVEGSRFLAEDAINRWVRPDVAVAQLETLRKSPEELKRFFASEPQVKDWLTGRDPLAPEDQTIVAAWLNVPAWKLLTDQQPDTISDDDLPNAEETS